MGSIIPKSPFREACTLEINVTLNPSVIYVHIYKVILLHLKNTEWGGKCLEHLLRKHATNCRHVCMFKEVLKYMNRHLFIKCIYYLHNLHQQVNLHSTCFCRYDLVFETTIYWLSTEERIKELTALTALI